MAAKLSNNQKTVARFLANASSDNNLGFTRSIRTVLGRRLNVSNKHNFNYDFGYKDEVEFFDNYNMFKRNGIARAVVNKRVAKTWETHPKLVTSEEEHEESLLEREIRRKFDRIRFWQMLMETDRRFHVGDYAGVIFQFADNKKFSDPVAPGSLNGLNSLVNIIPAYEEQLEITSVDQDAQSPTFGEPTMMTFTESNVDAEQYKIRSFNVHPDRVYIWSQDRTIFNDAFLEVMHNALIDIEKIRGGGGEGFWKNSKSQPVLEANEDVNFVQLQEMLGTDEEGLPEALDNLVANWSKGHDQSLMLQGMKAYTLRVSLPAPKEFYDTALGEIAAAGEMPVRILTGNQAGERASTEDAAQFDRAMMARRTNLVLPNIMDIVVDKFVEFGVLPDHDWSIKWTDLTGATEAQKLDKAHKMSDINRNTGSNTYSDNEIREATDMGPKTEPDRETTPNDPGPGQEPSEDEE